MADAVTQSMEAERALSFTYQGGRRYKVLPFALKTDKLSMYNYLVCLGETGKPMVFRLSRLSEPEVDLRAKPGSGRLPADAQADIKAYLAEGDISFLSEMDREREIHVRLTEKGRKFYNSILHMRPRKFDEDGDVYVFRCTEKQIENYFFKFGGEAEILEPESLREKLRGMYRNALTVYGG